MGARYLTNRCGISKLLTLILGGVCVAMGAYAVDRVWKEEVFLGVIIGCLVISILYLLAYIFVDDLELNSTNKAFDAGFHLLAALLILAGASLLLYSAVRLRWDTEYLCSGGIDRGIPCIYDVYDNLNGYNGINAIDFLPPSQPQPVPGHIPTNTGYGPSGYGRLSNGLLDGRSFFSGNGGNWLAWLKSSKAHLFEKCYEILPRILHCNRYFELKITAGVVALINGIIYAIAGILVLSSN